MNISLLGLQGNTRKDVRAFSSICGEIENSQKRTDIKGSDTEKTLRVVNASRLEYLCADGDGRVDWVADNGEVGFGAMLGASGSQVSDDGGVGLREIGRNVSVESLETECQKHNSR